MSKLLNDVIADAKAVKETAIQTAISTLRESFEPTVRRMISQKLTEENPEEESEFDYPEEEEEPNDDFEAPVEEPTPTPTPAPVAEPAPAPIAEPAPEEEDDEDMVEAMLRELEGEDWEDDSTELGEEEMVDDEEISDDDLDEILRELEGEDDEMETIDEEGDCDVDEEEEEEKAVTMEGLKRRLRSAKMNLKEAYRVIVTQKKTINEVHLLNLKLMNVTKINSKFKLGDTDKIKVLEAFDRADTAKEVKLVYQTLVDKFTMNNNSVQPKRKMHESVSRQMVKDDKFEFSNRFMELANIKKK